MTAAEKCHEIQQQIPPTADGIQYCVPYPNTGWWMRFAPAQVVEVLQREPKYYESCGPSIINDSEKALIALSGKGLQWEERQDLFSRFPVRVSECKNPPHLLWISEGNHPRYVIRRLYFDHGVYVPLHTWEGGDDFGSKQLHKGLNTLGDAKLICLMHFIEQFKSWE